MFEKLKLKKNRDRFVKETQQTRMETTWLIQRLTKPIKIENDRLSSLSESFAFGGGLKNGGLSKTAMSMIRPIFSFDYMGSAEFEFGNVPKTISKIATYFIHDYYSIGQLDIKTGKQIKDKKEVAIYWIANPVIETEVIQRITDIAKGQRKLVERTKEAVRLDTACGYGWSPPAPRDNVGWLELDNGFMFFTDKEMWEKTIEFFNKFNKHKD